MRIPLLLIAITWQVVSTSSQQLRVHHVSRALETFADRTLKVIAEDQHGNFVYSSISLALILSMVSVGAVGKTRDQLISAIERPYSRAPQRYNEPSEPNFDQQNGFILRVANKIFVTEGFSPNRQFSSVMMTTYHSPLETVDFSTPVQASKTINDWTAAQTNNRIKQLVQPADLNSETSLVLANTVYFRGNWINPFNRAKTSMLPFNVNRTTVKRVPTMRRVGNYNYGNLPEVNAKFIELPYVRNVNNQVMSMFVILPDEVDGLDELIRNFEKVTLQKLYSGEMWAVELLLPKFKVETKLDLESALGKLGLTEMFRPSADFSGITVERPLTVGKIVQRTLIDVNEQGTEAASATGMHMENRLHAVPEITFSVDRPFVSMIVNRIGMPYFTTVIVDPTSED